MDFDISAQQQETCQAGHVRDQDWCMGIKEVVGRCILYDFDFM